jgi:hypothetical protein
MPTLAQLIRRHPDHKKNADHWIMLSALAEGGCAVDRAVKQRLLINPDNAETEILTERTKLAPYDPVTGSILMKLTSQIMADQASYQGDDDDFWNEQFFKSGALITGDNGLTRRESFHSFLSASILQSLVQGAMIGVIDETGETEEPYVYPVDRWDLWDWSGDQNGLSYAKIHSYDIVSEAWDKQPIRRHRFTIYQRVEDTITASIYNVTLRDDKDGVRAFGMNDLTNLKEKDVVITADKENVQIFTTSSGVSRFPVVVRSLKKPLWISDQLYDLTISLFNHTAGGEWALMQTNYGMLKFTGVQDPHTEGNNNPANFQRHGNGYFMELEEGVDAAWLVRPGDDIELSLDYQSKIKQKMLDLVHKIAETAANAFATRMQSGESKKEGRRDLDILLEVYGEDLRGFATAVLNVASIVRNQDTTWDVQGFTDYNTAGLLESLAEYKAIDEAGLQSETLTRESRKAIAAKAVASLNLPPDMLTDVSAELDEDSAFTLSPEQMQFWIELAKINLVSPETLYEIANQAGLKPPGMSIQSMLATLGFSPETPQTDNPVLAGDADG